MTDDLVERLLNLVDRFGRCRDRDTVQEAADRIAALTANSARLRKSCECAMSDMPQRIWATPFDPDMEGGTYCDAAERPAAPNYDAWCYTRADTVQAQIDAAVKAERERWEAMSQIDFANQSTARSIRNIDALIRKEDQP
jgi:hypothetical protein